MRRSLEFVQSWLRPKATQESLLADRTSGCLPLVSSRQTGNALAHDGSTNSGRLSPYEQVSLLGGRSCS